MTIEAITKVMEALHLWHWTKDTSGLEEAHDILRDVLQNMEKQEPVAYLCENAVGHKYFRWKKPSNTYKPIALYTAPPAPVQEPVAWRACGVFFRLRDLIPEHLLHDATPLYTTPPAAQRDWVGLTDEEFDLLVPYCGNEFDLKDYKDFARDIEAKLKEKNT